jgi:hypothetical protein
MPHGDSVYNLNFRCLPAHMHMRILTVPVKDDNSIIQVKTKVAAAYHIPAVDQRYLFGGRVLDDERTLGELKVSSPTDTSALGASRTSFAKLSGLTTSRFYCIRSPRRQPLILIS